MGLAPLVALEVVAAILEKQEEAQHNHRQLLVALEIQEEPTHPITEELMVQEAVAQANLEELRLLDTTLTTTTELAVLEETDYSFPSLAQQRITAAAVVVEPEL
jgi:hypothetical protein